MKKLVFSAILILSGAFSVFSQDKNAILKQNAPSLVVITSNAVPVGYGFFVSKNLLITTINTIGKYQSAQVLLSNGKYYNILGYTSSDAENDLVLLKTGYDSAVAVNLNTQIPPVGQNVFLIDQNDKNNLDLVDATLKAVKVYGTVTLLAVETINRIKTTGLPAFDLKGNVIGISTYPLVEDTGTNFIVPAEKLEKLLANQSDLKNLDGLTPAFDVIKKRSLANMDKSAAVKEFLDQGVLKYEHKDYKGAIEKFNLVLRLSPSDVDALVFRGQSKYMLLQYKDAMVDFDKAIVLQPEYAEAYDLRGLCKAELGDKDGACEDWKLSFEKGYDPAFKLIKIFCDIEDLK